MVNILVVGRTGVGKSTLINTFLREPMCECGQGRPVTKVIKECSCEHARVAFTDTCGFELTNCLELQRQMVNILAKRNGDGKSHDSFHVAWLCISEDSRRIETVETTLADVLALHVPVIGVITKARADDGFAKAVQKLLPQAISVVRIRALREQLDDGHILRRMGLMRLLRDTSELLSESQRGAMRSLLKHMMPTK